MSKTPANTLETLDFNNRFARLPQHFYSRVNLTPFENPARLIHFNTEVANLIGLDSDQAQRPEFMDYLTGTKAWPGTEPLAMLYAGHQFGQYVPQLGDGRAVLLGEVQAEDGTNWDLQVKGSGLTPYSRGGDGRAVLRSTIREYLCSEAMHGLGIETTRALCMFGSNDEVYRESIETGAMLVRVAQSHVRFGSFEVFYYREQYEQVKTLADYVIEHHYPEFVGSKTKYTDWLKEITKRTAELIAQWQSVGFAHGVMNTDNMSILGLTLDYGPYGFIEEFNPRFVCNHSDYQGRYAFDQQPSIGLWNLSCLAQALTPLISVEEAKDCLKDYETIFFQHYYDLMRKKLGMLETDEEAIDIINRLLKLMVQDNRDYTITLRKLSIFKTTEMDLRLRDHFISRLEFDRWSDSYTQRLEKENLLDIERRKRMDAVNPKFVLRNYLAQQAIEKAVKERDYSEIDLLMTILQDPFAEHYEYDEYASEPPEWAQTISVSCSS